MLPAVRRATGAAGPAAGGPAPARRDPSAAPPRPSRCAAYGRGAPVARELAIAGVSLLPVFLALRDSRLSRYHGAEHKSVAAFEIGALEDASPREADREHARCGTNLVAPLVATNVAAGLLLRAAGKERQPLATLVASLVSLGTAMEVFSWMARHQGHPLAGALGRPGIELQRLFTTSEPSDDQLDVATRPERTAAPRGAHGRRLDERRVGRPPRRRIGPARRGDAARASSRPAAKGQSAGCRSARRLARRRLASSNQCFCLADRGVSRGTLMGCPLSPSATNTR